MNSVLVCLKLNRKLILNSLASSFLPTKNIHKSRFILNQSSNNSNNKKQEEMDHFKSNPYFEKYKNKLKNFYE